MSGRRSATRYSARMRRHGMQGAPHKVASVDHVRPLPRALVRTRSERESDARGLPGARIQAGVNLGQRVQRELVPSRSERKATRGVSPARITSDRYRERWCWHGASDATARSLRDRCKFAASSLQARCKAAASSLRCRCDAAAMPLRTSPLISLRISLRISLPISLRILL